jgi:hypothetical protein
MKLSSTTMCSRATLSTISSPSSTTSKRQKNNKNVGNKFGRLQILFTAWAKPITQETTWLQEARSVPSMCNTRTDKTILKKGRKVGLCSFKIGQKYKN